MDYQTFQQDIYDITGNLSNITINIPAGQDYLTDAMFWFYPEKVNADGTALAASTVEAITEFHNLIQSIEIKADGKQIMYLDQARFLLSILNQQKENADEHLLHKFDDYPLDQRSFYNAIPNVAGANTADLLTSTNDAILALNTRLNLPVGADALAADK